MSLKINDVIDGPLSGGLPKAIELLATADIADLSIYGIGSANNGGGSDDDGPIATSATIPELQGAGHISPFLGQLVATAGIVTAVDSNGFYLQDADGDGDIATSDAIFVFTGSTPGVASGDAANVTGTVSEFTPGGASTRNLSTTQISSPEITVESSGNALPAAVILGQNGRRGGRS